LYLPNGTVAQCSAWDLIEPADEHEQHIGPLFAPEWFQRLPSGVSHQGRFVVVDHWKILFPLSLRHLVCPFICGA
jgi:hypothetical protein